MKILCGAASFLVLLLPVSLASAYGPEGHGLVGAIADHRLAGKPAAASMHALLDGLTLAEAALLPDEIKTWDKNPDATLKYLPGHPKIRDQLHAFWKANPSKNNDEMHPSHHEFHYTDVPVAGGSKYGDGATGRSKWDIVQMIPFCIRVLKGEENEHNDRKITKPVALILLAHYLGDMHQPLHVGAEYFNDHGKPVNPDAGAKGAPDEGGNTLHLVLAPPLHGWPLNASGNHPEDSLHLFWDHTAAVTAIKLWKEELHAEHPELGQVSNEKLPERLAQREPKHWKLDPGLDASKWAEALANEILPIAKQAHEQLRYEHVEVKMVHHQPLASGTAKADGNSYPAFAGKVAQDELHKAGWRLAALLEQIVPEVR